MSLKQYEEWIIKTAGPVFLHEIKQRGIRDAEYLYEIVSSHNADFPSILEIGRFKGYSLGLMFHAKPKARIVSVDPVLHDRICFTFKHGSDLVLINGTSDNLESIDRHYDVALIDGDHAYESALNDYENVKDLMNPGGIIIFDDLGHPGGCGKVWNEIDGDKVKRGNLGLVFTGGMDIML